MNDQAKRLRQIEVVRVQSQSLERLRAGHHRKDVMITARDAILLIELHLEGARFADNGDAARKNYLLTIDRACKDRLKIYHAQHRARNRKRVAADKRPVELDETTVLQQFSMRDFGDLVEGAAGVLASKAPSFAAGHGSSAHHQVGDEQAGAAPYGEVDETDDGTLVVDGRHEILEPDGVQSPPPAEAANDPVDAPIAHDLADEETHTPLTLREISEDLADEEVDQAGDVGAGLSRDVVDRQREKDEPFGSVRSSGDDDQSASETDGQSSSSSSAFNDPGETRGE